MATARPKQVTPPGDWFVWLIMAGRGWGKTKVGAEDIAWYARTHPGAEIAVVGRTDREVRRVCVEGPSGLLSVLDPAEIASYNRSSGDGSITLDTGAKIYLASAQSPDSLLGANLDRAWCDELAAWPRPEAWHRVLIPALRNKGKEGERPQVVVTTTPRPNDLVRGLVKSSSSIITRGSTWENKDNLDAASLDELKRQYDGTRLGRQELYGELLEDVEGALWTLQRIEDLRVDEPPALVRIVVAVDPSGGDSEQHDEQGIVVAGVGGDGHLYVLADRSCRDTPNGWAARAIGAYHELSADLIVAESNYGGAMVQSTLRQVDPTVPVRMITASRGKRQRAEPVSALYEQGRVHHVGAFPQLEDQMCSWVPESGRSPDRMDALVWAVSQLALPARVGPSMTFAGRAA